MWAPLTVGSFAATSVASQASLPKTGSSVLNRSKDANGATFIRSAWTGDGNSFIVSHCLTLNEALPTITLILTVSVPRRHNLPPSTRLVLFQIFGHTSFIISLMFCTFNLANSLIDRMLGF